MNLKRVDAQTPPAPWAGLFYFKRRDYSRGKFGMLPGRHGRKKDTGWMAYGFAGESLGFVPDGKETDSAEFKTVSVGFAVYAVPVANADEFAGFIAARRFD